MLRGPFAMARLIIVEDNHELASLIASAARQRGHSAVTAHTGEAALVALGLPRFDVAIIDLLLPDMRGTDVLDEVRRRALPAIAISGVYRGERFAQDAMTQHGAAAFFDKPFEMQALLGAVDRIIGSVPGSHPADASPESKALDALEELTPLDVGPDEDGEDEPLLVPTPEPSSPEPAAEVQAAAAPEPAAADVPASPEPAPPEAREDSPKEDASVELPFAQRGAVWKDEGHGGPEKRPAEAQSGNLADSSLPKLLTAYYQARHSGELKLSQSNVQKLVIFEKGQPIYAASNVAQERFGRFCVRSGVISESDLAAVAALCREQNLRTGDAMAKLGLISAEQRRSLLEDQIRAIIWSTFNWTSGRYEFSPRRATRGDLVKLTVFPGNLILQGAERSETLVSLRQKMPASRRMFPTADPPYGLHEISLSDAQAHLLIQTDGSKTVDDLLALTDLPEREALAALLGFEWLGLIHERTVEARGRRISFGL